MRVVLVHDENDVVYATHTLSTQQDLRALVDAVNVGLHVRSMSEAVDELLMDMQTMAEVQMRGD